jgi:hypothetical protein
LRRDGETGGERKRDGEEGRGREEDMVWEREQTVERVSGDRFLGWAVSGM